MSPTTLRDKEHFTSALLKTEAGCGGVLFLDTTRKSVLVALNCTLLESLQKRDTDKVVIQRADSVRTVHRQAFRSQRSGFVDGILLGSCRLRKRLSCQGGERIFGSINRNGE